MIEYETPYGEFVLKRFFSEENESLQAWDSADLYVLRYLNEHYRVEGKRVLVVNDLFGAITIPMLNAGASCFSVSDSYISRNSYIANCRNNAISRDKHFFIEETQPFPQNVDVVLMKIPKSLAHLKEQLERIKLVVNSKALIIAADKTKNIHTSTIALFEKIVGATQTSLAWKKSRLILSENQILGAETSSGDVEKLYLEQLNLDGDCLSSDGFTKDSYELDRWSLILRSRSSVFSRKKLDQGTALLLQHMAVGNGSECIIDLACGNGVVGLVAKKLNKNAHLMFVDESYMAVESAKENYLSNFNDDKAEFIVDDCLSSMKFQFGARNRIDRIFCNPPFHQQKSMGKYTAHRMFHHAFEVLGTKGELWVVANRHLGYHAILKQRFGHCETVASNSKFVVLRSTKR